MICHGRIEIEHWNVPSGHDVKCNGVPAQHDAIFLRIRFRGISRHRHRCGISPCQRGRCAVAQRVCEQLQPGTVEVIGTVQPVQTVVEQDDVNRFIRQSQCQFTVNRRIPRNLRCGVKSDRRHPLQSSRDRLPVTDDDRIADQQNARQMALRCIEPVELAPLNLFPFHSISSQMLYSAECAKSLPPPYPVQKQNQPIRSSSAAAAVFSASVPSAFR